MCRDVLLTNFGVHGLLDRSQTTLELSVVRIELQSLLVRIVSAQEIALSVEGSTLASPTLSPVRLDLGGLVCVLESMFPILLGSVSSRTVAV